MNTNPVAVSPIIADGIVPKMVPWEPYKAAVSKMKPKSAGVKSVGMTMSSIPTITRYKHEPVVYRNRLSDTDINRLPAIDLVTHTTTDPSEGVNSQQAGNHCDDINNGELQIKRLNNKYRVLETEHEALRAQFDIQTKVNSELKQLLVATMGDDLLLKLDCLAQDKVKLGQDIITYTRKQSEDTETLDGMSIQCDVWRSKFLASSVLADELITMKIFLVRQLEQSQKIVNDLLLDNQLAHSRVAESFNLLCTIYRNLSHAEQLQRDLYNAGVIRNPELSSYIPNASTLLEVSSRLQTVSHSFYKHFQKSLESHVDQNNLPVSPPVDTSALSHQWSENEKRAVRLTCVDLTKMYQVSPCDDEFLTNCRKKMYEHYRVTCGANPNAKLKDLTFNCCKKCSGEIMVV